MPKTYYPNIDQYQALDGEATNTLRLIQASGAVEFAVIQEEFAGFTATTMLAQEQSLEKLIKLVEP